MKKRKTHNKASVSGYYINDVIFGFFGEKNEGKSILNQMGLNEDSLPFSVASFIKNRKAIWKDKWGNLVKISFNVKPQLIEFNGSYLKKHKSSRLFREWELYENPELIARLESEAIGDCCMRCIFEIINKK